MVKEFVDKAESARSANRPAFQEMIGHTKQKPVPFQAILVWKLSRFARNREDSILYKALLRRRGVQVISINEQIDESPTGRLLEGMIESIDEFYSANLGQDTRRGMKENAQRGFLNGAPVAFGYRAIFTEINEVKKRMMELDEKEAPIVRRVFDLFLQGEGAKRIAECLNVEGFRTRKGSRWNKSIIHYLLKNETYTGTYLWNQFNKSNGLKVANAKSEVVRIPNHHTSLVEPAIFDHVQRTIKERAPEMKSHPRAVASQHLLSGLVSCAHCSAQMIASTAKSGKFVYYSCQRKFKEGKASCSQKSLNAKKFEPCIVDTIKERLLTKETLSKLVSMVSEALKKGSTESDAKRVIFESQMTDVEKKLARYYQVIEGNALSVADVAPRLRELNLEKETLTSEIERLNAQKPHCAVFPQPSEETVTAYVEDLRSTLLEGSIMHRKAFLNSFIRRINIKDSDAEIEYSCPIGLSGQRKKEVLSMAQIGSRGRARTFNIAVNSRALYH